MTKLNTQIENIIKELQKKKLDKKQIIRLISIFIKYKTVKERDKLCSIVEEILSKYKLNKEKEKKIKSLLEICKVIKGGALKKLKKFTPIDFDKLLQAVDKQIRKKVKLGLKETKSQLDKMESLARNAQNAIVDIKKETDKVNRESRKITDKVGVISDLKPRVRSSETRIRDIQDANRQHLKNYTARENALNTKINNLELQLKRQGERLKQGVPGGLSKETLEELNNRLKEMADKIDEQSQFIIDLNAKHKKEIDELKKTLKPKKTKAKKKLKWHTLETLNLPKLPKSTPTSIM